MERRFLVSNWWLVTRASRRRSSFAHDVEVRMDHTSMTVMVLRHGDLVATLATSGTMDRKFAHYDGLYRHLLNGGLVGGWPPANEIAEILPARLDHPPDVWR